MAIRRNCLGFVEDATKIRCVLLLADFARVVAGAGSAQEKMMLVTEALGRWRFRHQSRHVCFKHVSFACVREI